MTFYLSKFDTAGDEVRATAHTTRILNMTFALQNGPYGSLVTAHHGPYDRTVARHSIWPQAGAACWGWMQVGLGKGLVCRWA